MTFWWHRLRVETDLFVLFGITLIGLILNCGRYGAVDTTTEKDRHRFANGVGEGKRTRQAQRTTDCCFRREIGAIDQQTR